MGFMRSLVLLFPVVQAGTHSGTHRFLGGHSALSRDATQLPFSHVSFAPASQAMPRLQADVVVDGEPTRVAWRGVVDASAGDLLLLTCEDAPWGSQHAYDALAVSGHPDGELMLPPLADLRCPFVLRYVRAQVDGTGETVAEAKLVHEAGAFGLRPKQAHLSFTANRDEMLLIWVTGKADPPPSVEWGFSPGKYDGGASVASSMTYTASEMCDAPANSTLPWNFGFGPGHIHRALMSRLPPSTTVYYRHGSDKHGWAAERSFRSRRAAGESAVKFIMYADQAVPVPLFAKAWRLIGQVKEDIKAGYDGFLLHPGDLGYARGTGYIWDVWSELLEPISSRVPYMVTVGNHEYDHIGKRLEPSGAPPGGWHPHEPLPPGPTHENGTWGNLGDDSSGECGVPVYARYNGTGSAAAPTVAGDNGGFWYSFDEGGVHVVMLSSEHDWRNSSRQYRWLLHDLSAVNRTRTPWVVLATHRMMYTTQELEDGDYRVSLGMREQLEPLLYASRVNLMLVGHQHSYERSCAAYRGACVADGKSGTVHIVAGSAGANAERGGFSPRYGNFSLRHVNDYGYLRLDANRSRLLVQWVRTNGGDGVKPGEVWDSVTLLPWVGEQEAGK
jgi:hypothetical protein